MVQGFQVSMQPLDFQRAVFSDPDNWTPWRVGNVIVFSRGRRISIEGDPFVTHGTTLSIAYKILRYGIKVGPGTHYKKGRQLTGWFCVAEGSGYKRIEKARNRAKVNRCPEYQALQQWPSGWSVPCVLAWVPWDNTEVTHLKRFEDDCWKSCIVAPPGTQRPLLHNVLKSYKALHCKTTELLSWFVVPFTTMHPARTTCHQVVAGVFPRMNCSLD